MMFAKSKPTADYYVRFYLITCLVKAEFDNIDNNLLQFYGEKHNFSKVYLAIKETHNTMLLLTLEILIACFLHFLL